MFLFKPLHFVKPVQTHGKAHINTGTVRYKHPLLVLWME
ncbi:hypothetical protein AC18_4683 [Escherichia coli 2-222-05_S3_C2]|nr:hypothetical protein EC3431_4895 [Escherichia coli 3431]EHV45834.1 hypothetical protein ECDEC5E_3683 [Escherichia coli DEC5E]KDX88912.1 hypothetical protein AC46_1043 [Escherichia coli 2-222-05_S3_C3]KEN84893.1 hypothetical protein AB88_4866 [Escherichia coli 2-222-05_S3_C1]KEN93763.1 hypothetical protein AC18_4683 [Escherichia coli 2-222-05_S3_C2]